ncbi:uncharacterized protein LOC142093196 [Calonectris borealis]|uniref:uncharacterized protein LOC142093196 n=1 Tax=Calonectris borealis TaxID=1323832 RepID=UPI003F4C2F93
MPSVPLLFALSWFLLRVVLPDVDCETSRHGQPAQVRHHQQRCYLVDAVPGAHRAYRQAVQAQDVNQCLEQREDNEAGAHSWEHAAVLSCERVTKFRWKHKHLRHPRALGPQRCVSKGNIASCSTLSRRLQPVGKESRCFTSEHLPGPLKKSCWRHNLNQRTSLEDNDTSIMWLIEKRKITISSSFSSWQKGSIWWCFHPEKKEKASSPRRGSRWPYLEAILVKYS